MINADFSEVEQFNAELEKHRADSQKFAASQVYENVRSQSESLAMRGATVIVSKTADGARLMVRTNDTSQ